jgi:uncharacterized RDD family membrane protein YckC
LIETLAGTQRPPPAYAGFWRRLGAAAMDTLIFGMLMSVLLYAVHVRGLLGGETLGLAAWGTESRIPLVLLENLLPAGVTIALWALLGATPGKFLLECRVVNASTGRRPGWFRASARCCCYLVSLLPLGLGFFWIAWDGRKQAWHDKLAGTLVVVDDLAAESEEALQRFVAD